MSEKEKIYQLIDSMPSYKLGYVLAYLQGLTVDEEADNIFCEELYGEYLKSADKGDTISLEEAAESILF